MSHPSRGLGLQLLLRTVIVAMLLVAPHAVRGQFASPHGAANLTTIASPLDPDIKIAYKVPSGACKTAFDTQQQYTGWVTVPGEFPTNLFFWFVASREPTSALTIWLNGGPGASSMFGFFLETGPCEVVERGANQLETAAREWGWDRASNMLFIDQPNQVGFSYDVPTNGSLDYVLGDIMTPPRLLPEDRHLHTFLNGTFSSQNVNSTANSTGIAAVAIWHMLQGFLSAFPQYNPPNNSALGINLFAESYGGKYAPAFAEVWEDQNQIRQNSSLANSTLDINLVSLGLINGCVDDRIEGAHLADMAINNTYGLQLISPVRAKMVNGSFYERGGCQDMVTRCRTQSYLLDNGFHTAVDDIDDLCRQAMAACNSLLDAYSETGRSFYDIAHQTPESFPPSYYIEYLNKRSVQDAIGSVVNYTDTSKTVYNAFLSTGDWVRSPMVPKLATLLARGVRIGLVYGDRDYICNWLGGEAVSLSIASTLGGVYGASFPTAGYAPIIVNNSYIGGVVRQFGNLSFSRIYQAGHFVPAYQPETAFQVFARIITGTSLSTGAIVNLTSYNTTGPANATASFSLPSSPTATCYVRALDSSCPQDTVQSILNGKGVVINGAWYPASSDWPGATLTSSNSGGTPPSPTSTPTLTGLFTATATPQTDGALRLSAPTIQLGVIIGSFFAVKILGVI